MTARRPQIAVIGSGEATGPLGSLAEALGRALIDQG